MNIHSYSVRVVKTLLARSALRSLRHAMRKTAPWPLGIAPRAGRVDRRLMNE